MVDTFFDKAFNSRIGNAVAKFAGGNNEDHPVASSFRSIVGGVWSMLPLFVGISLATSGNLNLITGSLLYIWNEANKKGIEAGLGKDPWDALWGFGNWVKIEGEDLKKAQKNEALSKGYLQNLADIHKTYV